MDLSRRGVFGTIAAALMAPSAAAQASGADKPPPAWRMSSGVEAMPAVPAPDPNWFWREKERLEKLARGEFDADEDGPALEPGPSPGHCNIDALRSVSAAAKGILHRRESARRHRAYRMWDAARQLKQLLSGR